MAKFYGVLGYATQTSTVPGVIKEILTERNYYGDVVRNTHQLKNNLDSTNDDIVTSNMISIVADDHALNHFFAIRYVEWAGCFWKVTEVTVKASRLILRLGGIYNGPKATRTPVSPGTNNT